MWRCAKSATLVGWKTAIPDDWIESNIFLLKDQISKILIEAKSLMLGPMII